VPDRTVGAAPAIATDTGALPVTVRILNTGVAVRCARAFAGVKLSATRLLADWITCCIGQAVVVGPFRFADTRACGVTHGILQALVTVSRQGSVTPITGPDALPVVVLALLS
jgi:hypothetical protein